MIDKRLEIFRMAAVLNHFSDAAAALGMTQPNVTQQIASLEKELGVKLFYRFGRNVSPTPSGTALLAECGRLFADAAEIRRRIRNASDRVKHYRIGGTMTAGGYLLPELAARYMEENPRSNIGIHIANTADISDQLKSRSLDLALVEGPFDRELFLSARYLEDELRPVSAPGVLPEVFSLAEYLKTKKQFVLRESGSGTRYYFDLFLKTKKLPQPDGDRTIIVNSFDAIKHLVRGGHGITVISELAVQDERKAGTLRMSRFSEGVVKRGIDFIYLPDENLGFAEKFIAFCRESRREKTGGL